MTLDDQIAALGLKPGQISILAGYRSPDQLRQHRQAGRPLTSEQLLTIAAKLDQIAERARAMAERKPAAVKPSARRRPAA